MTIQCLYQDFTIQEVGVPYRERPEGSTSKLNTFGDGTRILLKIFHLLRAYKPLTFFGGIGIAGFVLAAVLGAWGQFSVAEGHTVWSAAISLVRDAAILIGGVFVSTGIILHTFNYRLKEIQSVLVREQRASPVTRR